jgi:hypothetical protein
MQYLLFSSITLSYDEARVHTSTECAGYTATTMATATLKDNREGNRIGIQVTRNSSGAVVLEKS